MAHRRIELMVLFAVLVAAFVVFPSQSEAGAVSAAQRSARKRTAPRKQPPPRTDYTKFSHRTTAHQMACDTCHKFPSPNWKEVRTASDAFEDITEYPQHASCLSCHRQQFFAKERPAPKICSVCHVAVTPRSTVRFPFPNPVERYYQSPKSKDFESAFRVGFPHDKHIELFGRSNVPMRTSYGAPFERVAYRQAASPADASCVNCHVTFQPQGDSKDEFVTPPPKGFDGFWLRKGTFKTAPTGHTKCFECHTADSGMSPAPTDCAVCHKLRTDAPGATTDFDAATAAKMGITDPATLAIWRSRASAAAFPHEGGLHTDVGCTKCHNVSAMDTTDPRTMRVRVQSCGGDSGCHVTATVDDGGALNYELEQRKSDPAFACAKCHVAYSKLPVPAGHRDAVAALGKD
jgi:hypothetical protein